MFAVAANLFNISKHNRFVKHFFENIQKIFFAALGGDPGLPLTAHVVEMKFNGEGGI